jgi:Predicted DNA binding protein
MSADAVQTILNNLSETERAVLRAALAGEFFSNPEHAEIAKLAAQEGLSEAQFCEHLETAEATIMDAVFPSDEEF